jgi:hypothetical protein
MSDANATTVQSYDAHIQEYINGVRQTVDGYMQEWIDRALSGLPHDAQILEIGSAFGRDADYMESQGYTVERTDVTPGFVRLLQDKGHEARLLNALTDDIGSGYDLVFADAVLLHFTRDETKSVISKVHAALSEGGRFAFTLKAGEGEEWKDTKLNAPRYFCYWTKDAIWPLLKQAGFISLHTTDDHTPANGSKPQWIRIVATKST